jgi:ATP-binding cassette subfamily B protein
MFFSAHAVVMGIGASLFYSGAITIGTVYLVFRYALQVTGPMNRIMGQFQALQGGNSKSRAYRRAVSTRSAVEDGPGEDLNPGAVSIEFDNVSFGYDEDDLVLKDILFKLQPGRVLGLLGRTGSGKSTLARLLFRLYDPSLGTIRLQGVDVRLLKLADLRRRIGLVTQDVQLFNASVRDNITFFDESVSDQRIIEVLAD